MLFRSQEHPITVVSAAPISEIIGSRDASGRVAKWAIELAAYAPQYARRDTIKSQAVVDFLVDWAEMEYEPSLPDSNYWRMHFDGSKVKEGLGAGVVLTSPGLTGRAGAPRSFFLCGTMPWNVSRRRTTTRQLTTFAFSLHERSRCIGPMDNRTELAKRLGALDTM